jgi:hypothetical protein
MRFFKTIAILIIGLIVLILAICLNDWFTRWSGTLGILSFFLLVLTWISDFYYFKNERFYLLIQKLLLLFRRTDTTWFFNVNYKSITKNDGQFSWQKDNFAENIALKLKESTNKPVLIKKQLSNLSSFSLDSLINLTLRYSSDQDITLTVDKLLAPAHRYKDYLHILTEVFSTLERELLANKVCYSMHIELSKRNPYFGFFIRHIPEDGLSKFRCTFTPSIEPSGSTIDVQKSGIVINTDSINKLRNLAISYLSLSNTLITGESK